MATYTKLICLTIAGLLLLGCADSAGPRSPVIVSSDSEAVDCARRFLFAVGISTNGVDIDSAPGVRTDRSKGVKTWLITWRPDGSSARTNALTVWVEGNGVLRYAGPGAQSYNLIEANLKTERRVDADTPVVNVRTTLVVLGK